MKMISFRTTVEDDDFPVTKDRAIDPDGFEIKRAIIRHRGSAVMMAVDEEGACCWCGSTGCRRRTYMWELPAGRMDAGGDDAAGGQGGDCGRRNGISGRRVGRSSSIVLCESGVPGRDDDHYLADGT